MSYFLWGTIILFVATVIFYIVFFSLIYYWRETKVSPLVVPLIFTFEFFLTGFLVVSIVSLILQYLPKIIELL